MRRARARLIDHSLCVSVSFGENFLVTLLRFRKLLANPFRVQLSFLDLPPAIFENGENRFVGKSTKQKSHDAKTGHLREEQLPIPAECFGGIAQHLGKTSGGGSSGKRDCHGE